ncbi:MAG TPA: nucleotide exchange factor GrpE [Vicinamibacterales bacterium]|nr:nucleotide exchange factor GrpE [Vicinamibacterales bacterium]
MSDQSRRSKPADAPDVERMESEGAAAAATDPAPALADEIMELRKERDTLQDRLLRQAAEFDNYRKRVDRERKDLSQMAAVDFVQELLPVIDDFERALQSDAPGADSYRQGLEIIHRALMEMLRKRGVTPIDAVGTPFDPQIHQAVAYEDAPDRRDGEVMEQFTRGYRLGDRLVRPAMVKVAKA